MSRPNALLAIAVLSLWAAATPALASTCTNTGALGVSRIVEIDTANGPLYGDFTKYAKETSFLGPKEVVLTFDDGPMPWVTKSILDTLDRHCTKATFFSVGKMALAYPASIKDILARGHTLGGHTHTHPLNIPRLGTQRATDEIERGMAAIALAAGQPIAPFFRFPGLSDSPELLAHLQKRGIAAFTVDVVSNDSYIGDAGRLTSRTLDHTERRNGGILLFHDIKAVTARALPAILDQLKSRGYKVVHMVPKAPLVPLAEYHAELTPKLAKVAAKDAKPQLLPFYGAKSTITAEDDAPKSAAPDVATNAPAAAVVAGGYGAAALAAAATASVPVTTLAPAARDRFGSSKPVVAASSAETDEEPRRKRQRRVRASTTPEVGGWVSRVQRDR